MKLVATADWGHNQSLRWRGKDNLYAIDQLIAYAEKFKPDVILHGGDLFHSRSPSVSDRREIVRRLKTLVGISPVVIALGNHDISATHTSLDDIIELAIPWLYIPKTPQIIDFKDFGVLVFPWLFPEKITMNRRFSSRREKSQAIANLIDSSISAIAKKIDDSKIKLLVAHATAFDAKYGEHRDTILGDDIIWRPEWWKPFDFVCLGHIHRPQQLRASQPVVYPGSLERTTYGEWKEEKGFYTWDSEKGLEFHKVKNRPMYVLQGIPEEIEKSASVLPDGSMVKCKVRLDHGQTFTLPDQDRFAEVMVEKQYPERVRPSSRAINLSGMSIHEVMDSYWKEQGKSKQELERLLAAWKTLEE